MFGFQSSAVVPADVEAPPLQDRLMRMRDSYQGTASALP